MTDMLSFDPEAGVFRDQMGMPLSASEVLWYIKKAFIHISHTEAELYLLKAAFLNTTDINFNYTNIHEECVDEHYLKVKEFIDSPKTIRHLIAEASND